MLAIVAIAEHPLRNSAQASVLDVFSGSKYFSQSAIAKGALLVGKF